MASGDGDAYRLFLLGDARQVHLTRWAEYFLDAGYDVLTASLERGYRFPGAFRRIRVTTSLPHAVRYPLAATALRRIAGRFRPHVVNAHFVPNYGLVASMLGRHPWVLSTWGSDVMTDPDKSPFHKWRTRRVLRSADWVTSDAESMTTRILGFGVSADRVLTFPYGVDTGVFRPLATPLAGPPRIVSNRKHEPVYDVATLIDAFPAVLEAIPGSDLTVAGDGALHTALMTRARRSIVAGAITFVGALEHAQMPGLLRASHIYVSTALSDTTSVSLLEAMACGLFPVVTDIAANHEWITHGYNGFLVPPGQPGRLAHAIIEAWTTPMLIQKARERNLAIVAERAQWRANMQPVRELFDRLCSAGSAAPPERGRT